MKECPNEEQSFDAAASRRIEEKSAALDELELAKEINLLDQSRSKMQSARRSGRNLPALVGLLILLGLAVALISWIFMPASRADEPNSSAVPVPEKVNYKLGLQPKTYAPKGQLKPTEDKNRFACFTRLDKKTLQTMQEQSIAEISMEGTKVKNSDLKKLAGLKSIYMLDLQDSTGFSKKGLRALKNSSLKRLYLDGAGINDKWISTIIELPVVFLSVMGNKLSDESIETLSQNTTLRYLKFEAESNSKKIQDAFRTGHWMRLPEGSPRVFNYYRNENPPPPQQ